MRHVSFLSLIILIAGLLPIRLQAIDFTDGIFKCSTGVENTAYIAGTTTKIFERITVPETVTDKSGKKYTVTHIERNAFEDCPYLISVTLPETIELISNNAFKNCANLKYINLPEGMWLIGSEAFYGCSKLTSIEIPTTLSYIRKSAFYNCKSLSTLILTGALKQIDEYAFYGCSALTEVEIPNQVTNIGKEAFTGCYVDILTIGYSVETIEGGGLPKAKTTYCYATVPPAFKLDPLSTATIISTDQLYVPEGSETLYRNSNHWANIQNISTMQVESNAETVVDDVLVYKINEDGKSYSVSGCGNIATEACIKNLINGMPVTEIAPSAFEGIESLTTVSIPPYVSRIGKDAFKKCKGLKAIYSPSPTPAKVEGTSLFPYALDYTVYIQNGSKGSEMYNAYSKAWTPSKIESYDFSELSSDGFLYHLYSDINNDDFYASIAAVDKDKTEYTIPDHIDSFGVRYYIRSIYVSGFEDCKLMERVSLPETIEKIYWNAFTNCESLKEINIPQGLKNIYTSVFEGCTSLTKATFNNAPISDLPASLFKNCASLTSFDIPSTVTKIGSSAFEGCSSLPQISLPQNLTELGDDAFNGCVTLNELVIPASTVLGNSIIKGCTSIRYFAFPETATKIPGEFFAGCEKLQNVYVPAGIKSIGYRAFHNCRELQEITIPKSVSRIEGYAFENCESLTSITFPYMTLIYSVGEGAFSGCTSLESADFGSASFADYYLPKRLFYGCKSLKKFRVPRSVSSLKDDMFNGCSSLQDVDNLENVLRMENRVFAGCSSLEIARELPELKLMGNGCFADCSSLTGVELTAMSSIPDSTFINCTSIRSMTLPDNIHQIGAAAFKGCDNLMQIGLPDNIYVIGKYAFQGCNFTQINLPKNLNTIGESTFEDCIGLTEIVIPDNVFKIDMNAFAGCRNVETLTLGKSLSSFDSGAFVGFEKLKTVYSLNPTPPQMVYWNLYGPEAFFTRYDATLYVPTEESRTNYIDCLSYWFKFSDIRVMSSGIESVENDNEIDSMQPATIYNLNGICVFDGIYSEAVLAPGIYIVKQGTTLRKIRF